MTNIDWLEPNPQLATPDQSATPIVAISTKDYDPLAVQLPTIGDNEAENPHGTISVVRDYLTNSGWRPKPGTWLPIRGPAGRLESVVFAASCGDWRESGRPFDFGDLPNQFATAGLGGREAPAVYKIAGEMQPEELEFAALGWLLGSYQYRPRSPDDSPLPLLVPGENVDAKRIKNIATGVWLARRLIETPANIMTPEALATAATQLAEQFGGQTRIVFGDDLLTENYPLIHAVGRASAHPPRLVDFTWGDTTKPAVTLVGKGICFDTGGLDLKPSANMLLMKKDMGGAATTLALAYMIMAQQLPVRLRVLLPIAENSVSGSSFRPGDVLSSRKDISVEVGNTDAEGRLVLADALADADSENPELLVDFATLTGAARVALGADLPAVYTKDKELATEVCAASNRARDPLWHMPLWSPYMKKLDSRVADISSTGTDRLAGSITAALFLSRFVEHQSTWVHVDLFAWNPQASPGRPRGAECQAARAVLHLLEERYGTT